MALICRILFWNNVSEINTQLGVRSVFSDHTRRYHSLVRWTVVVLLQSGRNAEEEELEAQLWLNALLLHGWAEQGIHSAWQISTGPIRYSDSAWKPKMCHCKQLSVKGNPFWVNKRRISIVPAAEATVRLGPTIWCHLFLMHPQIREPKLLSALK